MAGLQAESNRMIQVYRSLSGTWDSVRGQWKGADRESFEREHIQEIVRETNSYIASLRHLAENIQRILNEAP